MDLRRQVKKLMTCVSACHKATCDEEEDDDDDDDDDECVEMPKSGKFSSGGLKGSSSFP